MVKIFRGFPRVEKIDAIIRLETTPANNRRLGRETAGKPENHPIVVCHRPIITNIPIHKLTTADGSAIYKMESECGKKAAVS
jgi:hypothetical protein